ncbi:MAG: hypothetical protein NT006_11025 [Candidatus Aminicenantes bacterium]|nr:hypothetical protein [Candidatus Aminicenantes bacterium]
MRKTALLLSFLILAAFPAVGFEKVQRLTLPADGLTKLEITAGAGSLTVSGRDGLAAVEVEVRISVSGVDEKEMEDWIKTHVELELRKAGDAGVLVGEIHSRGLFSFFEGDARIDLTVSVPKSIGLKIDDGSGEMVVEDLKADIRIKDGSGAIRVGKVTGNLRIDDGSGEIAVDGVEGNVDIIDGSGGMEVRNVTGDVSVDDGSGGITLLKMGGNVTIDDGSGHLEIDDVGKDVHLRHKGSGSVDIANVRGKVIR